MIWLRSSCELEQHLIKTVMTSTRHNQILINPSLPNCELLSKSALVILRGVSFRSKKMLTLANGRRRCRGSKKEGDYVKKAMRDRRVSKKSR